MQMEFPPRQKQQARPSDGRERPETSGASSVSRVNDEFAVGYNEDFEQRWWRIEIVVWILLIVLLAAGMAGLTGRGLWAKRVVRTPDGELEVKYERVARYKTPSIVSVRIGPTTFRGQTATLWVSRTLIEEMGVQRVIPQPMQSIADTTGIAYVFPVGDVSQPIIVGFAAEPAQAGIYKEEIKTDSQHDVLVRTLIVP